MSKCEQCKGAACEILGECVFNHAMIRDYPTGEPRRIIEHAKELHQIANTFRKIKGGKPFNGELKKSQIQNCWPL